VSPRARKPLLILGAAVGMHLGLIIFVFLSTRQDLAWHLATAFPRLAFQNSELLLALAVCAIATLLEAAVASLRRPRPPSPR
jgi:hypothetical protein